VLFVGLNFSDQRIIGDNASFGECVLWALNKICEITRALIYGAFFSEKSRTLKQPQSSHWIADWRNQTKLCGSSPQ